jgi:magnesium transporter
MNTYLSVHAQKTNEVMKLLTVFSAFFLPLTFIAGIYGMNFKHMPELNGSYSYFIIIGLMAVLSIVIFLWFRKKKIL